MPGPSASENQSVAAVVPAAGLSIRMQAFKPLLSVAGRPLLIWCLTSLYEGGIGHIELVLGRQAEDVGRALAQWLGAPAVGRGRTPGAPPGTNPGALPGANPGLLPGAATADDGQAPGVILDARPSVHVLVNHEYANSDMLHSVQLGLAELLASNRPYSAACILPGDMPAVSPASIQALLAAHRQAPQQTLRPSHAQRGGHPVLLPRSIWPVVTGFNQAGGLCAALAQTSIVDIAVADPGVLLDADYPPDLAQINDLLQTRAPQPPGANHAAL